MAASTSLHLRIDHAGDTIIGRLGDVAGYGQSPVGSGQRYLGEYHDVSYSLGTFKSVHIIVAPIGIPGSSK
jgi:hypothetical protein